MLLAGNSDTHAGHHIARWHRSKHPGAAFAAPFSAIAWCAPSGLIENSAVFCNFTGPSIDIHLVLTKPSIRIRNDIYKYVFEQLKCARLTAIVPEGHAKLLRMVRGLGGWRCEGSLLQQFSGGETGLIFGLLAEDVKKVRNG